MGYGRHYLDGTDSNDHLVGGSGGDDIYGELGNDVIFGHAGSDYLQGDDGDDQLHGNQGDDVLEGANGNDILLGGQGNDYLDGGGAYCFDQLFGGSGDDTLVVGSGGGSLHGATGNDLLEVVDGHFWSDLHAGAGNDVLVSNYGYMFGDAGEDQLYILSGTVSAFGGDGADTFHARLTTFWEDQFNPAVPSLTVINDFHHGEDKLDLRDESGAAFATLDTNHDGSLDASDLGAVGSDGTNMALVDHGNIVWLAGVTHLDQTDFIT